MNLAWWRGKREETKDGDVERQLDPDWISSRLSLEGGGREDRYVWICTCIICMVP